MITVLVNVIIIEIHEVKLIPSRDDFLNLLFTTCLVFEVYTLNH